MLAAGGAAESLPQTPTQTQERDEQLLKHRRVMSRKKKVGFDQRWCQTGKWAGGIRPPWSSTNYRWSRSTTKRIAINLGHFSIRPRWGGEG